MKTQPPEALKTPSASAGAVLLWCVLAAGAVALLLLVDPPPARGLEFWTPVGTLRILADLILFYVLFLVPVFHRPGRRSPLVSFQSAGVVLYTGALGLVMLNYLSGVPGVLSRLVPFLLVVSGGALIWSFVLERRRGVYYPVAVLTALGLPVIGFFCKELFRIEANWLNVLSPFTAWRTVLDGHGPSWAAWVVFDLVLVSGAMALFLRRRREHA
ncbi:MAG TPA: hypothetical protein VMZ92_12360 [Planctomycetota bacterium]|nr:hypothetical protein [Planctomycetota bacterium]